MTPENINPEDTNPEEISNEEISESAGHKISAGDEISNAHEKREELPHEGPSGESFSSPSSSSARDQEGSGPGKTAGPESPVPAPEIKKLESESFNMSSSTPPQVPPKKKRSHISYIAVVFALLIIIGLSMAAIFYGFGFEGDLGSSEKVAVIYVQGTMLTGNIPSGLGYATSEEISENIRRAVEDEGVRAIVLRVNSGGGSPAAAQEIVGEIQKAQEAGVPVVISMGDVAASAAYYISAPSDYIIANPSTSTGSIGVIWVFQNLSAYYDEEGIEYYIAKSGELKDMGGSWRGLTDEEKEYADKVVLESYEDFVAQVADGRNMTRSEVKALADGRIYTGKAAIKLGLVDETGNLYDAIDKAAELGGIEGEPRIVYMNRASLSRLLLGSESSDSGDAGKQLANYFEESPYGKILA
ncbi:signal peptide peptidase SppA [Methanosarcina sp. KYL-1]|uniref:signal peptide peptidase SppA n=1 Tax=Methanosarcina sp. KYL-1 TaxID=2602068 RepID=UPI0021016A83|nr:signal peptide peptidase SppA [Methanosarcina sp. KYL-1]MCQ1534276.1 signal peptide peptidase SppA [Methanosarcina sp. KYL-1]